MDRSKLSEWAAANGVTVEKAESLLRNIQYRKAYRKEYNKRPAVVARRREVNRREYNLRKSLDVLLDS